MQCARTLFFCCESLPCNRGVVWCPQTAKGGAKTLRVRVPRSRCPPESYTHRCLGTYKQQLNHQRGMLLRQFRGGEAESPAMLNTASLKRNCWSPCAVCKWNVWAVTHRNHLHNCPHTVFVHGQKTFGFSIELKALARSDRCGPTHLSRLSKKNYKSFVLRKQE